MPITVYSVEDSSIINRPINVQDTESSGSKSGGYDQEDTLDTQDHGKCYPKKTFMN